MEKLLNLLNEYMFVDTSVCEYLYNKDVETIYVRTTLETGEIDDERVRDEWIISKRFGFIKWLVDNDKIDTTILQDYWDRREMGISVFSNMYKEDFVILTLSIQSEPIKFLISILR